jgi:hypothetical protein
MAVADVTMDIGDVLTVFHQFVDNITGEPTTPDDPLLTLRDPDGDLTEPAIHNVVSADELAAAAEELGVTLEDGTGVYAASIEPDLEGRWWYRWSGDGAAKTAGEVGFNVRRRRVGTAP